MSNALAIAAVTSSITALIDRSFGTEFSTDVELLGYEIPENTLVTAGPPDKARGTRNENQINLFLYHVSPNAAWRNLDLPSQARAGEAGHPPLALDLYYLLTAYSEDEDGAISQRLLGRAMRVLHDHPVLLPGDVPSSADPPRNLALSALGTQVERVRVVPHAMPMEELSRLWQTFQTQYRASVAYRASVVLIESRRPVRASLPVLRRGADDRGARVAPDLAAPPFPFLLAAEPPTGRTGAAAGETFTLRGGGFSGATLTVQVEHQALRVTNTVTFLPVTVTSDVELPVTLPVGPDPAPFPAGPCTVSLKVARTGHSPFTTGALPLLVLPEITGTSAITTTGGHHQVPVAFTPPVKRLQRVSLLLNDREFAAPLAPDDTPRSAITFAVPDTMHGPFLARLRVDGVDSALVDRDKTPPIFDAFTITLPPP